MNRVEKIREGNRLFNDLQKNWNYKTLKTITELFYSADYQDGLFRLADFLYYDKHLPLLALSYYKKINSQKAKQRISEIKKRMILAFKFLLKN